jgi:ABC-type phosphate transport system substrate-binding protein
VSGTTLETFLAIAGVIVPIVAFLWEFVLRGRKQLGYRVQMDTTVTDEALSEHAGAWRLLEQASGAPLDDPSIVLLRIENIGMTNIDTHDYAVPDDDKIGIRINFPGRRVAGMVVTDLSQEFLRDNFGPKSGLAVHNNGNPLRTVGIIELPKAPLNAHQHYKVLAVLERASNDKLFRAPQVVAGIKGGVRTGGIKETQSRTGIPRWVTALICSLLMIALAEPFVVDRLTPGRPPLDCAAGTLDITGSTAFQPVIKQAASHYEHTCPGSQINDNEMFGSAQGLEELNNAKNATTLAFSDGVKTDEQPELLPRPIALLMFTVVINKGAGVRDLSLAQVQKLFAGGITNWDQIGGNNVPVRIIDRDADSGTRATLEQRVLNQVEPGENSSDCVNREQGSPNGVIRCRMSTTTDLLHTVAQTPGAVGYSELGAAQANNNVFTVSIDGRFATLQNVEDNAYPYWQTEYAYTYSEPQPDSLAASFLRYLTNQVGMDIIRFNGDSPCSDMANPALCQPQP